MVKYKKILSFEVEEQIHKCVTVYCIDRQMLTIKPMNGMFAGQYVSILKHDNSDNRFEFYIAEESEEE